jgi:hypothetical protein
LVSCCCFFFFYWRVVVGVFFLVFYCVGCVWMEVDLSPGKCCHVEFLSSSSSSSSTSLSHSQVVFHQAAFGLLWQQIGILASTHLELSKQYYCRK